MSSPGETPSSILRETLLEFSRRRRKTKNRARTHKKQEQEAKSSSKQLDDKLDDQDQDSIQYSFINSLLTNTDRGPEAFTNEAQEIRNASRSTSLENLPNDKDKEVKTKDVASGTGLKHMIYLHRHETYSYDSLVIDDIKGNECSCNCCPTNRYYVPRDLKDGDKKHQTRFIQKVFTVLLIKAIVVLCWLKTVEYVVDFKLFYKDTYQYHFISGGIYIILKILIRLTKNCRKGNGCLYFLLHLMELVAAADFIACAVSHYLDSYYSVPRKVLLIVTGVYCFFIFVGFFVNYDMNDGVMVATALIVTLIMSIQHLLRVRSFQTKAISSGASKDHLYREIICAVSVVGIAEILIMIIIVEMKSVLMGRRFSPSFADWFYTSIYII